ncbi:MAG: calcium-binding protein, partial [Ferrovibrionaceae bacterium]
GNDTLIGGAGNDTLIGGFISGGISQSSGLDRAVFSGVSTDYQITVSGDTITVTDLNTADGDDGTDVLYGIEQLAFSNTTLSYQTITGTSGNDNLTGTSRDESISGGDGNDTIDGGMGGDTLDGGNGFDWLSFANAPLIAGAGVSVTLYNNTAARTGPGYWVNDVDTVTNFEGVRGTAFNDFLYGRDSADDWFEGGAGADEI